MAVVDDSSGLMIDEPYEFSAPRFFDFIEGETEEERRKAELWFDTALSYAPSPFMQRIKTGRSVKLESLCDFSEGEQLQMIPASESEPVNKSSIIKEANLESEKKDTRPELEIMPADIRKEEIPNEADEEQSTNLSNLVAADGKTCEVEGGACTQGNTSNFSLLTRSAASPDVKVETLHKKDNNTSTAQGTDSSTPKPPMNSQKGNVLHTDPKKQQAAKKIASIVKNPSALKSKNQLQLSQAKSIKPSSVRRETSLRTKVGTPMFSQENQAIKRQKLEGGQSRQILSINTQNLPHKRRPDLVSGSSNPCSSTCKTPKGDRKMYVREPPAPFVSMAEMMKRFQSNTREMTLPRLSSSMINDAAASAMQRKHKLKLTRPKEPEFETAQRVRSVRVKSSAELEEEMMAKIPKFKARPVNKKILEAPTLSTLPRSTPQLPEFQEFHLETMVRANHNAETSTIASTESASQNHQWRPHLTAPKEPILQTSLRARPPRVKCSDELEKEELNKIPKFKARPLNRKIFESKGELGIFCNTKRQVTVPQEFHFATDERIPPTTIVTDLFDKLSLNSEPHHDKQIIRNTAPNPFHLQTEERGAEKERKFVMEVIHKQIEEERARVPKASPYPYTTDYPVLPPKPEPKQCTKPEPFQLESLVRHEEEMHREMEERRRMEEEEAQRRIFKAQPILKEDPIPVSEKVRKPLTEVQEFDLHVEHRAVDRAEFDKKIKEKEMIYKRYREESESEKMMEEEKALKQLRRTLVPHARPVPNFDRPFLPQKSSKDVTKPKSPKLKVLRRRERREMSSAVAAASSAASNMR
ncbi:hypothetical protein RJ639_028778 [Escallonia herrerae]|uniref:Targeting protein for Xklp2 n=1 Tax=Escallonia herrerae TaxID=1293975 RepID=A0AA88XBQ2_9ASTE|nr:hypothetical protein RJ639_028778 [Escallonia herrerae]